MEKIQAKGLIEKTFNNRFDKENFRNFIINFLDGIDESKFRSIGNAQVKESFQRYILSYQRLGQYKDVNGNVIDVLIVHLGDDCSLDRNRTMLRNFVADYMRTRDKENTLVAFYNDISNDWRFSFVKLDVSLKQDDNGNVKVVNEFTPAKRYSFLVGELEPNHTAQSRLVELLIKEYPTLSEIEEAFNVEKVSKEFFANYKELFLQLVDNLKEIRANEESQRINHEFTLKSIKESDFCKKLLGQLVFLYFIQKKGWLGVPVGKNWGEGDKQFLRHTFERAVREGKNFFNDYLEHLFYNALANGERDDQYFSLLDCKIPFLNGGLFETIGGYSWTETDIIFDNSLFSNSVKTKNGDIGTGILDVFDRYNFTVKEDEPLEKEVAVDPEMLGKVFEELLEVQDRKSKGAFYTPREIVHYMCQESLINYLTTELDAVDICHCEEQSDVAIQNNLSEGVKLTKQDIADFIHHSDKLSQSEYIATKREDRNSCYKHQISQAIIDNAKLIDKALENIKICDPAIGSGAFPVGMLNEIVRARIALVESGFLKETNKRSIYEYKRQAIQNSIYGVDIEAGAVEIAKLRLWLSLVVDEENIENIKALPNLDYKIVQGNSLLNVERNLFNDTLFRQLEELKPQFFNETRKSEKKRLKKEIDAIIKELTKDGTFDFEIYFSEVFNEKGGFDVVIANPPYVEFKNLDKKFKSYLLHYKTTKGKYDLYVPFIEKGLLITTKNGCLTYICPTRFMTRDYGIELRNLIKNNYSIESIIDFSDVQIFDSAMTYTGILTLINNSRNHHFKHQKFITNVIHSNELSNTLLFPNKYTNYATYNKFPHSQLNNDTWHFQNKEDALLFEKIIRDSKTLKSLSDGIYQGIATGKDNVFIIGNETIEKYGILSKYIYKMLKGKDISAYKVSWKNKYVIYPYTNNGLVVEEEEIKNNNPNLLKYLYDKKEELKGRTYFDNSNKKWYELWNQRNLDRFTQLKIITLDNASRNSFALDNKNLLGTTTTYSIILKDKDVVNYKFVLAILNSKLLDFYHKKNTIPQAGGYYRYQAIFINGLPIKNATYIVKIKFTSLVDNILSITQTEDYLQNEDKQTTVKEYEKQIDIMVYKLYDLTYDEVLTIDKDFTLTEQEYNNYQL